MHPAQLALPGCSRRGTTLFRFPEPNVADICRKMSARYDVALTSKDLARIDEVAPHEAVAGARYPDWAMEMVNR